MKLTDVADVLSGDFLSAAMCSGASEESQLRRKVVLELFLAAAHHDKIREAIGSQFMHLESTVPTLLGLDHEEGDRLRYMLRTAVTALIGPAGSRHCARSPPVWSSFSSLNL